MRSLLQKLLQLFFFIFLCPSCRWRAKTLGSKIDTTLTKDDRVVLLVTSAVTRMQRILMEERKAAAAKQVLQEEQHFNHFYFTVPQSNPDTLASPAQYTVHVLLIHSPHCNINIYLVRYSPYAIKLQG